MDDRRSHPIDDAETANEEAFRRIFDTYYSGVVRFFLRRGVSLEEARDLTQETFLNVYRGLPQFRGEEVTEGTWLFKIAYNLWLIFVRRSKAEKRQGLLVSLQEEREERLSVTDSLLRVGQEEHLMEKERSRLLQAALADLPDRMRQCVLLYIQGYKYREISVIMQCSMDSVKSLLHQSRKRLQERLGESFTNLEA
jgi:RNA polymerase sigma-70 factor, ECF subfamily